eukprot:GFUD01021965.1.p1 GENE.GFUD01021965.1~~GFUD01021965.1.p1  ORF type:complete len:157 (+),score=25.30 GFUD01021965.1:465-935(+)
MDAFIKCAFLLMLPKMCVLSESHNSTMTDLNVFGTPLEICSFNPLTGWFRDGYCRTNHADQGVHVVCATMTKGFLAFTRDRGNDLSTRRGSFPGLNPGDRWCLCATRWREAMMANVAPLVVTKATHEKTLQVNSLQELLVNQVTRQHIMDIQKQEL